MNASKAHFMERLVGEPPKRTQVNQKEDGHDGVETEVAVKSPQRNPSGTDRRAAAATKELLWYPRGSVGPPWWSPGPAIGFLFGFRRLTARVVFL